MKKLLRRILLAVDGSPASDAAVLAAADISSRYRVPVSLVHVYGGKSEECAQPGCPGMQPLQAARDLIRQHGGTVSNLHLRAGRVINEIVREEAEMKPDLVVIGARGNRAFSLRRFTSVAEALTRTLSGPLLIVRPGTWPPQQILIGDDGSDEAARAGEVAVLLGRPYCAEAQLVESFSDAEAEIRLRGHRRTAQLAVRASLQRLERRADLLAPMLGRRPGVEITPESPALALSVAAQDGVPTLLAVGRRKLPAAQYAIVGSTSGALAREPAASVLVVPYRPGAVLPLLLS